MSDSAHVASLEAVARFTTALRQFDDEATSVLLALDQQIQRALHWLDHEQPAYWRQQIRRQYDEVARTRTAWENCMLRTVAGDRPTCLEEEQAHRAAKKRLEAALAKPDQIRRWAIKVHQEVDEYRGRIGRLRHSLEAGVPRTIGLLERTQASLESYVEHRSGTE
ncbi:MAG: hypothetical protein M3552_11080 [Planctomycetota bacterium]|nr:hypothetical protein [Planctomycetota bacterium]